MKFAAVLSTILLSLLAFTGETTYLVHKHDSSIAIEQVNEPDGLEHDWVAARDWDEALLVTIDEDDALVTQQHTTPRRATDTDEDQMERHRDKLEIDASQLFLINPAGGW